MAVVKKKKKLMATVLNKPMTIVSSAIHSCGH